MTALTGLTLIDLRGNPLHSRFLASAQVALGCTLPLQPNTAVCVSDCTVLWLGPDEWLLISKHAEKINEQSFVFGKGRAYGAEFFIKKARGRLNGWVGYTWSRTLREFKDINNGNPYPSTYDRIHDVVVVANYQISRKWEASGLPSAVHAITQVCHQLGLQVAGRDAAGVTRPFLDH